MKFREFITALIFLVLLMLLLYIVDARATLGEQPVTAPADDGNVYAAVDEELEDSIEVYLDLFDREA